MKTHILTLSLGLLMLGSAGCATNKNRAIIRSFEDITSGKHQDRGTFGQIHAASINGLLPFDGVGETYFFAGQRGVLTAIGVSPVINTQTNVKGETLSYKLIRDYPSDATLADLTAIRSKIAALSSHYLQAIRAKKDRQGAVGPAAVPLQAAYTTALANADTKLNEVVDSISKKNILLFQWDTDTQSSFGVKLGSLFTGNRDRTQSQRGFGLVAGLRTSHLYVGEDLILQLKEDVGAYTSSLSSKIIVPTYTVAASTILYFAQDELAKEVEAHLKASYSELTSGSALVKSIDKIELDYIAKQMKRLSNIGLVQGPPVASVEPLPMYYEMDDYKALAEAKTGWTTFYAVMTSVNDIFRVYQK